MPHSRRGTSFRHELLVEASRLGVCRPGARWARGVERELDRAIECLLGPDAPIATLLEAAGSRALRAWPPPADEPLSIWVRRVAAQEALEYLEATPPAPETGDRVATRRPGGAREVLSHLHARLRGMPPQDQLAFALLELNGSSVSEAAAVLRLPMATILRRVARVRRQLAFAARRDRLLLRYLCMARRLRVVIRSAPAPSALAAE